MKKVKTKQKPDIEGKLVDQIEIAKVAFMIGFDADEQDSLDEIKLASLKALFNLSQSKNKRTRLRDFVILTGTTTNRLDINLFAICFPKNISSKVIYPFYEEIRRFHPIDTGIYPIKDFTVEPLARYKDGKLIVYTDFSSPRGWLPSHFKALTSWGAKWETRSTELSYSSEKITFHRLPKGKLPQRPAGERHSREDYIRLSQAIDDILLKEDVIDDPEHMVPFGYSRLRWFCKQHLGIQVREENIGGASGRIRVGKPYLLETGPCAKVLIEINRHQAEPTKYVALAHELAHYRLHFPWLMVINLAYDQALTIPETAILLENFMRQKGDILQRLEDQADLYSSYFLVPPIDTQIQLMAKVTYSAGQTIIPQELAWNFLAPFFPAHDLGTFSWSEHEKRSKQALDSLLEVIAGVTPEILLNRYYAALIKRLNFQTQDMMKQGEAYELLQLLSYSSEAGVDIQTDVRRLIDRKVMLGEWRRPATTEDFLASFSKMTQAQLGPEAQISSTVPQQIGSRESHCPVSVFIPARPESAASEEEGLWVPLPGLSEEMTATRQQWVSRLPDHGLYFTNVPERTREFLVTDSADERQLVIIPTSKNLAMRPDQDWYVVGVRQNGTWLEEPDRAVIRTKNEWATLCVKKGLGLTPIHPLKRQLKQLRQLQSSDPFLAEEILQTAKNVAEIDLLLDSLKTRGSLEIPAWQREDYFEKDRKEHDYLFSTSDRRQDAFSGPDRYAYRIMQDLVFDEYSGADFWEMMFLARKILRHHAIPPEEEKETLEIIRDLVVDCHLEGDITRDFSCQLCGKPFPAVLDQNYVLERLETARIICELCTESQGALDDKSFIEQELKR